MGIDLARYRDENSGYYGDVSLADVAADLHERSGSAAAGVPLDQFAKENGFDGQLADEVLAKGGFGLSESKPTVGDYARSVGVGLDQFGQVLGRSMQWVGLDRAGKAVEDLYKQREAATRSEQTDAYKAEMSKSFLRERSDGGGLFGYGLGEGATSPTKILGSIIESAPSMAAAGGPGIAATKGLIGLGLRSGVAGIVGSGLGEGTIGGLYAAKEGEDQILQAPDEVLRQHPDYQKAFAEQPVDLPEEARHAAARASVARSEALRSGLLVGTATAALGAPSGHFMGKSIGGETGKTLARTIGKQAVLEAGQEASQNAVEKIIHNQAARKYIDPNTSLWEGVAEEAMGGAITGGVMGGGLGGFSHNKSALRYRQDFQVEVGKALADGSVAGLSDADLSAAYRIAEGQHEENPDEAARQVLLGLNAEQLRRQGKARGFPLNEILAEEVAARAAMGQTGEAVAVPEADVANEPATQLAGPDRATELAKLSKRQLNDLASGLGINTPGRIKRDALVASVLQAEEAARKWNEPDAVEARYLEAHAAPFPASQDDFLGQAAPVSPEAAAEAAVQESLLQGGASEGAVPPDRAAELADLSHSELRRMAASLGIEKPGRMRRDVLVPAIVAAEERARQFYEPENIEARYQEEHAAPFPGQLDDFLDGAAPTGRRARPRKVGPAATETALASQAEPGTATPKQVSTASPTGEIPLVEAGSKPAAPESQPPSSVPPSRPALVEQTPEGALPTGEVPLVEAGQEIEAANGQQGRAPNVEAPVYEAANSLNETPPAVRPAEDLAAKSKRELNALAASLGVERPGGIRREDLVGRIEQARQEPAAQGQPEASIGQTPATARPQTEQARPWMREGGKKATVGALLRADDHMVARKPVEGQVVHFEIPGLEDVGFVAHHDLNGGKGWTVTETQSGTAAVIGAATEQEALRAVYDRLAGFDAERFRANRDDLVARLGSAEQTTPAQSATKPQEQPTPPTMGGFASGEEGPRYAMSLRETRHAKRGHPLYVVTLDERTSSEAYAGLKKEFVKLGGYWSGFARNGAIKGIQFTDKAKAEAFLERFGKKSAVQESSREGGAAPARESRPSTTPEQSTAKPLGVNSEGNQVFEDERGNRSVREGGVRIKAPVPVRPTRAGVVAEAHGPEQLYRDGHSEFLTKEELAAFERPEASTPAGEGLISEKEDQGARDAGSAHPDRSRPDVGLEGPSDVAPGEQAPGDVGGLPDESGRPERGHRPEDAAVSQRPVQAQEQQGSGGRDSGGDAGGGRAVGRPGPERGESSRAPAPAKGKPDMGVVGEPAAPKDHGPSRRNLSRDHNHRIAPDDVLVPGGNATRAKANLAAVRLLKELEAKKRLPTPQERKVLAQFSGWGSLAEEVFKRDFEDLANRYGGEVPANHRVLFHPPHLEKYDAWRRRYGELHPNIGGLFSKEEWDAAKRSTLNAHYTDRDVVTAMWDMVRQLGFAGGQVVEPAAGIGHFFGLMPEDLAAASHLKGVELDSITGRLLDKLYPAADIQVTGFQDAKRMGNNTADLVISNVPFGDFPIYDKAHKDYSGWSIHNYFLARALDVVRPGGLVAAITSHYTMDTTRWGKVREYLAGKADLVGAIRLPGTAFSKNAGTDVTTDILILRKKDGRPFEGQPWRQVEKVETPEGQAGVNEYFVTHPKMVLGRHSMTGSMHGGLEYTVLPDKAQPLIQQVREAVAQLPVDILGQGPANQPKTLPQALGERADADMREGTLVIRDGDVFAVEDGRLARPEWQDDKLAATRSAIARKYVGVKAAAQGLVRTMLSAEATEADVVAKQKELGRLYDAFVEEHGPFLDNRKLTFLRDDVEYPNVLALEKKEEQVVDGDKKVVVTKADIFTKRTIRPFAEPRTAASAEDAVKISLLYRGHVDAAKIGELLGLPEAEARRKLVETGAAYENPETGLLETPQEYLSGDVRQKLQVARDSAESNPDYKRNLDALEAVQPPKKPVSRIDARLGATWIPDGVVSAFMEHMGVRWGRATQTRTRAGEDGMSSWDVKGTLTQEAQNRWTVGDTDLLDILQDSLNLKLSKAYKYLPDGNGGRNRVVDQEGTLLVQEKQKALHEEFLKFARETPKVATELENLYDERFGGQIPRQYNIPDVAHYPGAVDTITLRDHQKRGVSRGLQENTLFSHGVGSGKTYLVTTLAMEARRLGTAKKPMIVVQGATLEQFASAFKRLYPAANVLAPNAEDRTKANRQRLLSQIATGDWDAVIVPHSFFNGLAISPEREAAFIEEDLDALRADLREAQADKSEGRGKKSPRVKQIEKMMLKREARLKALLDARKDENVFFEDTGVDMLVVDEAHAYKRGDFVTKMDNVKGLDRDSSQRSMQLLLKSRYIAEKTGGKNVHLATGTPVSNTLAELWTALRYIRPDLLERFNVTQFDDFASTFCATKTDIEETATGDYKPVTRFNRYQNLGELISMWKAGADIVLAEDLDYIKDIPKLRGGRPQEVSLERNPELTGYIQHLKQRRMEWEHLTGKEKREQSHVPLLIYNLAQKAALDMRLVNPELGEAPGGKIDAAAEEIFKRYQDHQDTRAAQAVFSDIYQSSDKTFNVWKDLKQKLVAKGIPAREIAIIYDFNEKAREKLFEAVNAGDVRVVMGSTEKLGVGVNIQERLAALHHLSPPVRPMDWEQRNGRIRRQGNMFGEVEVLAYGVKNTLDSVSFNILQNKQKFINQLLRGEIDGDVMENPFDDVQLSFEDMMAAFSGNPLAMERVKLEGQVRDLGRLRQAFQDEKAGRIRQLDLLRESRIPAIEKSLAAAEKEVDRLRRSFPDFKAETFTLKDGTFEKKDFTRKLTDWYDGLKGRLEKETVGKTVAHYEGVRSGGKFGGAVTFETGGHEVEIKVRPVSAGLVGVDSNRGDGLAKVTEATLTGAFTVTTKNGEVLFERNFGAPSGFIRSFNNGLEELSREPERIKGQLDRARESAASLERLVEEKFTREDEYSQVSGRLREVEEELKKAKNEDLAAVAQAAETAGEDDGGPAARLSRAEASAANAAPIARAVAGELRKGIAQFPALRGIVDIYHAESDLPADLRREVEDAGVSGRFYGAYNPETKRIALVAGNIPTEKAGQVAFVQTLLRHEGRHGGLDLVLGGREARQEYMTRAAHAMPRQVSLWLERQGLDSTRATRAEAAEEILVSWAKDGTVHRVLDRLLAKMAEWVRSIFPSLKLTKAELRQILALADDFVDGKGLDFVAPVGSSFVAAPAFAREETRFARAGELAGVPVEKEEVATWFKGEVTAHVRSFLPTLRGTLKETAVLGKILRSPEYWKHPVLKRLYEIFRDRTDQAHELLHAAFDLGDGRTIVESAKEVFKDKKQREILNQGVDYADVNEIKPEEMEAWFREHGATEATIGLWRSMRDGYDMLLDARLKSYRALVDKARDSYGRKIVRRLVEAGVPAKEAQSFDAKAYHADRTLSDALAPYSQQVAEVVSTARKAGITIQGQLADVRLSGEDGTSFSLKELIERMGQLRGSYAPRLRETGEYVVRGQRMAPNGKLERFRAHKEWRSGAESLRAKMARAGWDMEPVGRIEKLPEATQGIIKALELAKTVESAVNQVGEDVDAGLVGELLETLADEVKARGFRAQSIRRTGRHGDVVQGYFVDALERYTRYAGATAYGLAKMEAAGKASKALFGQDGATGIDIQKERDVYRLAVDYLAENLRNAEAGDRVFSLAKSVASLKYLGLNPRSALVNLSSMATSVPAALHAYALEGKGGWAKIGRETARAMADYLGVMTGKWGSFTADEKRFLEGIRKESLDDPQFAREALSTYRDTAGTSWSWLMGKTLALFGATEQLNRGSTLLAAYRLARSAGADHEAATARARETSDRAHGVYDRATQPAWTWGTSAGSRLGQSWYVYKKYGHNYLQLVHELFQKKDWQAATFALAAPMALGGLGSQVLTSIVKALFVAGGSDDDPEKWLYDFIRRNMGDQGEELARFGLLGLVTGTDMSGSLGTMIDTPDSVTDVLGPMGGLARDVLAGIGFFAAGQPGRGAEKILPTGLSKILQAARESSQGVSTSKNFPVVGPDGKRLMPTAGESAAKALGFRPAREATARARTSEAIEEEKRWSEKRDKIYSRFRAFTLAGGNDADERQALVAAVAGYNKDVADAGLSGRVTYITRESLLHQTERLARPTKREQARLGDKSGMTKPYASVSGEDIEDLSHPYYAVRRNYTEMKERYDALRQAGDLEGAATLRGEVRLPLLRRLIGRVSSVREEMGKVRESRLADDVKSRRMDALRERERLEMDRAARMASGIQTPKGE
jgi:N12 class adenine-specific DNA methylase